MTEPFSYSGNRADPTYRAIRDEARFADVREEIAALWSTFGPFAERGFARQFAARFQQRYWELYLGAMLVEEGLLSSRGEGVGPDFSIRLSTGGGAYIEAIAIEAGNGASAVPPPDGGPDPPPELALRVSDAVCAKADHRHRSIRAGRVHNSWPYVVAVNIGGLPGRVVSEDPPTASTVCLGVGAVGFTLGAEPRRFAHHVPVTSRAGAPDNPADTALFASPSFRWLSGMLISDVNPTYAPKRDHVQFLHNPFAAAKMPIGWLARGSEWRVNNATLERMR